MKHFVAPHSIVRQIWGNGDTILFIFAGASAEFALNKAVDWLYYTGKLPADPLGRLFSTVAYARQIIFSEYDEAIQAIDRITAIHKGVEQSRGAQIPDWAYRDVLFMLIDYSIRSYEVLERELTADEKQEVFDVFYKVGYRMHLTGLPATYHHWQQMRQQHLRDNMINSHFTADLYRQYKKHLGFMRYNLLKQAQVLVVPQKVNQMLGLNNVQWLKPIISIYKLCRLIKLQGTLKNAILPQQYKLQIMDLDIV
ncbi:MAG: oxygenase MpaB family protein [Mucilaginibacter sp.]|uniref:oxygenase MpaB family protein n=1 Tax=Mucilaginibacter sp. TaxID=1882438 RepID=UPI00326354C9